MTFGTCPIQTSFMRLHADHVVLVVALVADCLRAFQQQPGKLRGMAAVTGGTFAVSRRVMFKLCLLEALGEILMAFGTQLRTVHFDKFHEI